MIKQFTLLLIISFAFFFKSYAKAVKPACSLKVTISEGEAVSFNKKGTLHAMANEEGVTYIWAKNGEEVSRTRILMVTESGRYTVVVKNRKGCNEVYDCQVTVNNEDLQVTIAEGDYITFQNAGTLHALPNQTSEIKYEWWKDNRIIGRKSSLVVNESGMYRVVVTVSGGRIAISGVTWVNLLKEPKTYKVRSGDDLPRIAKKMYDDADKWLLIYEANKKIVKNIDFLLVGTELVIPKDIEVEFSTPYPIKIISGTSYPPFVDDTMHKDGMLTELVGRVFTEMNQQTKIEPMGWRQGQFLLHKGSHAAAFPYVKNAKRAKEYFFSEPLHKILSVWFVRADSKIKMANRKDFKGRIIAKPIGYHLHDIQEYLDDSTLILKEYETIQDCFQALYDGHIDVVAAGQMMGMGIIRELPEMREEDFRVLSDPIGVNTLHLMVSKKMEGGQAFVFKFNKILERLKEQGIVKRIKDLHIDIYQRLEEK